VAASWAPIYGIGYLTLAVICWHGFEKLRDDPADWQVFTVWWLGAIGAVLSLVAPVWVANQPRRHVRRLVGKYWPHLCAQPADGPTDDGLEPRLPEQGNTEQLLLHTLFKYDLTYRYLITDKTSKEVAREKAPRQANPHSDRHHAEHLRLTFRGRGLLGVIERERSRVAGRLATSTPRTY
jgi:hypothetical protein